MPENPEDSNGASLSGPPTKGFEFLSLHDGTDAPKAKNNALRAINLDFTSLEARPRSPSGLFVFGTSESTQSSPELKDRGIPDPSSHPFPTSTATKQRNNDAINPFYFGQQSNENSASQFSFRQLDVTPPPTSSLPAQDSPYGASSSLSKAFSSSDTACYLTPPKTSTRTPFTPPSQGSLTISAVSSPGSTLDLRDRSPSPSPSIQSSTPPAPYDARAEVTPSHPFFTSAFQRALRDGTQIAREARAAIGKLARCDTMTTDPDLKRLLDNATILEKSQVSDTRTVAVLGDSGEGKSSLINSLLHFPGIAQTGDIGSACTSVVTEYIQKKQEHDSPITIEVEYLSAAGIEELVKELLWNYRKLYLPGVESDDTPAQDYARYMRESEQAWSALHAAFGHQRKLNKEFLRDMSDGALDKITDQVLQWTNDIVWPSGGDNGFWKSTAETADECVEKTKLFMRDMYWPFTKIIRVYLSSPVLETGLILADLPGLQDTNLARVRATQDYLVKCDNIFIVAKISRALTDQSLESSLFWVVSRHIPMEWEQCGAQNLKITVVCTKSEDINLRTAKSEFCGLNKRILPMEWLKLDEEIDNAKARGDRKAKKEAKRKQEFLLIKARNDHVKEGLQSAYASEMQGKTLGVFCVSNTVYEKHCAKGNNDLVMASGIPELRRFCYSITADAQLGEAKHFLQSRLSTLLNSLDLWAESLQRRQKEQQITIDSSIYDVVKQIKSKKSALVADFRRNFETCFQDQISSFLEGRDEFWGQAASRESSAWIGWHWTEYNAWCLNNGDHTTTKQGHVNWNTKLIWKMRMELDYQWDLVEEEVSEEFSTLFEGISSQLNDLKTSVQESTSRPFNYADSLVSEIDHQIENLKYKINKEQKAFATELKTIRRSASDSGYSSYILKEMIPSYRDASNQYGTGKAARQRSIVQGHIQDGTLFPNIATIICDNFHALLSKTERRLKKVLGEVTDEVKSDIDIIARSNVTLQQGSEDSRLREQNLLKGFTGDIKALEIRQQSLLNSIKAF